MKIIRKSIKTKSDPIWIGKRVDCDECGCIFELEASDKDRVADKTFDHGTARVPRVYGLDMVTAATYVGGIKVECPECKKIIYRKN